MLVETLRAHCVGNTNLEAAIEQGFLADQRRRVPVVLDT